MDSLKPSFSSHHPRVLLIKPFCYSDVISPPLGIGYLAAALQNKARVFLLDGVKDRLQPARLQSALDRFEPDLVGLSVVSAAWNTSLAYLKMIRQTRPQALTLAGGPHPSLLPESCFAAARGNLDYILRGDAEAALRLLIERYREKQGHPLTGQDIQDIPGIYTETGGEIIQTPMPVNQPCHDPVMPAWQLMPPAGYPQSPQGAFFRKFPVAPLITSRGCPHECGFCSVARLKGRQVRFRRPDHVTAEIQLLRSEYGVREIQFIDDNLTAAKSHVMAICESMLTNRLCIPWSCPNGIRADTLDEEMLEAMRAAGCYSLSIGLEAGTQAGLTRMNKHLDLEQAISAVHLIAKKKLEVNGFFVLGYPGETRQNIRETIQLAKSLPLTRAHFMLFTPLPGCREFDRIHREAKWDTHYDTSFAQVSFVPEGFTSRQLKWWHRRAIFSFYGRPEHARKLLAEIRSLGRLRYFFRRTWHWLSGL
ncbi:MAG: B12-binding domain-containing radical SAM protein [Desulfosudaceae bacterium]